jgi:hypothetical protein
MNKNYSVAYPTDKNRLFINRWMFISEGMERGYKLTRIHKKRLMIYVKKKEKDLYMMRCQDLQQHEYDFHKS